MVPTDLGQTLQEVVKGLFRKGARFRAEKIGILVGFVVLSLGSVLWAFSEPADDDALGAQLSAEHDIVGRMISVENTSDRNWRDVRIVLDQKYLFVADEIEAGEYLNLDADEFIYAYYIPRSWGQHPWEELADSGDKPNAHPPVSHRPSFVQIRAREGRLDEHL